ncbi:MAG TPA: hypothetical protein VK754_02780 [Propionibacteriaceae bacterium]|nr:hypothetical protein [Propionibacteriaceae bacterium]
MSSARISPTADVVVIGGRRVCTSTGRRLRHAGLDAAVVVGERAAAWQCQSAGAIGGTHSGSPVR